MEFAPFAVLVVLFVLLTPGLLLRIPPGGGKLTVAIVHAILFAVIYTLLPANTDVGGDDSDSFKGGRGINLKPVCLEYSKVGKGRNVCVRWS